MRDIRKPLNNMRTGDHMKIMDKVYKIDLYFTARKTITVYAIDKDDAQERIWENLDLPDDVRVKEVDIVEIDEEENYEDE